MNRIKILSVVLCALSMFSAGCRSTAFDKPCYPGMKSRVEVIGSSVKGRAIELYRIGEGTDIVMVIAGIHGNEPAGIPLVYKMMEQLCGSTQLPATTTLLVVPLANPDGYAAGTRGNVNGIDINRNFPAKNRVDNLVNGTDGLNEPESRILFETINRWKPARIVSIHQPLECIDYDGPAESIAEAMAKNCDLPVNKLGARPGSLGSWAGVEMNIPTVTLELRKSDSQLTGAELWNKYGPALLSVL